MSSFCFQVDDIPPEQHALVPSFMGGGGKKIHPLPFSDPNLPGIPDSVLPIGYSTHGSSYHFVPMYRPTIDMIHTELYRVYQHMI